MSLRVVVVQRVLPHYRVRFFELLDKQLAADGIRLEVIAGQPTPSEVAKDDQGDWLPAHHIRNRYVSLGGRTLCWQPAARRLHGADLVILEQASRLLLNYVVLARRGTHASKTALWGHGENLDRAHASATGERIKRWLTRRADWCFAYTAGSAARFEELGMPSDRITVVQNSTDTRTLRRHLDALTSTEIAEARARLGLADGPVAMFLGSLYTSKRIGFLLEASALIRERVPGFQLLVVGDGPDRHLVEQAAAANTWITHVGAQTGTGLVACASTATLLLNPGLVGLSLLDSFALRLPIVTCDLPLHSPEFEYLEDGVNGVVLPRGTSPIEFAQTSARLLAEPSRLEVLKAGCATSELKYGVEAMASRFASGVRSALEKASRL